MSQQRGDIALQFKWADMVVSLHVENVAYYPDVLNDMGKQMGDMFRQMIADIAEYDLTLMDSDEEVVESDDEVEETTE